MPIAPPPDNYEHLIEGQDGCGPPSDPATVEPRLRLQAGWQNSFGTAQKYFRVVGIKHTLVSLGIPHHAVKDSANRASALASVPAAWHDGYFPAKVWQEFSETQFDDAILSELQKFDRAALSILYFAAALDALGCDWNVYHFVRLRPVTFYIEGFNQPFFDKHVQGKEPALRNAVRQEDSLWRAMAQGLTFVSRKTAETALQQLKDTTREADGLTVECSQQRSRSGKRKWVRPSKTEKVHYHEDEYLLS